MAAISGVSSQNLAALNRVLSQVGKGMDPDSPSAQKLDDVEAKAVIGELNQLKPEQKAEVTTALAALLRDEFIQVTPTARKAFADAMGVKPSVITPKQTAELAGLTQARSAFAASMQSLAKTPQMSGNRMKEIMGGLEQFIPPEAQKIVVALLMGASKEGVFKMDTNARKVLTKTAAKLDQGGEVTEAKQAFAAKRTDAGVTSFQRALAKGGFFEDILAAFMFDLIQEIQGEVLDKAGEFDRDKAVRSDGNRQQQQVQNASVKDLVKSEAGKQGPVANQSPGASKDFTDAQVEQAQKALEAVVQSVDFHKNDDGKIDLQEASKIASKLSALQPPVDNLVAQATLKALANTDMDTTSDSISPVVAWAMETIKQATGQEPDLAAMQGGRVSSGESDDPIVQALANSDSLENKIASFMLQAFVSDKMSVGEKVSKLRAAKEEWGDAARHAGELLQGGPTASHTSAGHATSPEVASTDAAAAQMATGGTGGPPGGPGGPNGTDAAASPGAQRPGGPAAQNPGGPAGPAARQAKPGTQQANEMRTQSRQELMEELKKLQQELQQALQALSNILSMLHQNAMNSIRSIR